MIGIDHKQGAQLRFLHPALFHAWHVAERVFEQYTVLGSSPEFEQAGDRADAILTSGVDGEHSDFSLHYLGLAFDLRTRHISREDAQKVRDELVERLGPEYKVLLESTHLHISLRPAKPLNYDKWA